MRTLSAAVFTTVLLLGAAGCSKKVVAAPPKPVEQPKPPPQDNTPPPPARINSFTVEPTSIERGQAATLRWAVANSTDINISAGIGDVQANGQRQVFPTNTTSYTLTARSAGGNDTRTVTVVVMAPAPAPTKVQPPAPGKTAIQTWTELEQGGNFQDALFDYDKSDIRADAQQALTRAATSLKQLFGQYPSFKVIVDGDCDERGSAEYNLGLGDRRATSARDFLVQLGVPSGNLSTISYGKERPVCTDASEACYQRNRRAHLSPGQ
jgi:peptidoglycan-associated lipoprotein